MKLAYYPETDSLYIELSDKASVDSQEIKPGIGLDMDEEGNLVGLDIDQASKRVTLSGLEVDSLPLRSGCVDNGSMTVLDDGSRKVMDDLWDLADGMVGKLHVPRSSRTEVFAKEVAYAAFFVRAVRIFRAFANLAQTGFGPEATLLVRPFCDTMIDWFYIESNPDDLGERYLAYQRARQLQQRIDYGKPGDAERYITGHGDSLDEFRQRYCNGKMNRLPNEWHGKKMNELSREVGLEHYYPIFGNLSDRLHNNPSALPMYVGTSDAGVLEMKTGPDVSGLGWWIGLMCLGLHLCLQRADRHFGLHSESDIVALGEQVMRYANLHGDTSA